MIDWVQLRGDFPILSRKIHDCDLVYLDSAASSLKPRSVVDRVCNYYSNEVSNVHRGIHYLSSESTRLYEETRTTVKKFINAASENEIIFTRGTTESINLVASSWGEKNLKAGDVILLTEMEHHSNIVPWQMIAEKKGAKIKFIPINDKGELIIDDLSRLLEDKTVLLSIVHISNTLGTINPLKDIIAAAKSRGVTVFIDAAQSVPHMTVDVKSLGCDFLAFSGHKVYGPNGVGVLYGREDILKNMPPYQGGGAMIEDVTFEKTTYNDLPIKFEAGTPPVAQVIGLGTAIKYIKGLGMDEIVAREEQLLRFALEEIEDVKNLRVIGTADNKASILSFVIDGLHAHDIGMVLDQQGIAVRTGHHCTLPLMRRFGVESTVRASFALYNDREDIKRLVAGVRKAQEILA